MAVPTPQSDKPAPHKEKALDDALADSFPASDPVAPGAPHRSVIADKRHLADHVAHHDAAKGKK
jgi:hypothetical protein